MSAPFNTTATRFRTFCSANDEHGACPDTRLDHIPLDTDTSISRANEHEQRQDNVRLQCCCGRPECAYLKNNDAVLGGIERDLETAARLGQALLHRHESYVNESQLEHDRLDEHIRHLERERSLLQTRNDKIVEENRDLLSQLEVANAALRDSDSQVRSLEALLRDCEVEVRRLNGLTRRNEELELKMLDMEKERFSLSQLVDESEGEVRSTLKRWRESELKVKQLEFDLERIEWEAMQDRERHVQIIAKLERERALDRELGGAEGRLKGAAALQGLNGNPAGNNVVSHFVRDILQDNANLQAGVAELRELLQASNDEVQNLREQILQHQPVERPTSSGEQSRSLTLDEQLGWTSPSPKQVQQEVHVHHHYHAKIKGKKERAPSVRRPSRKRTIMGLGVASSPGSSAPSTPSSSRPQRYVTSPVLPMMSLHQPQPKNNRWSMQSTATGSSMMSSFPGSPRSNYDRSSTIFDRIETGEESSRPTSPESTTDFHDAEYAQYKNTPFIEEHPDELRDEEDVDGGDSEGAAFNRVSAHQDDAISVTRIDELADDGSRDLTPKPSKILVSQVVVIDTKDPGPPGLVPSVAQSQFAASHGINGQSTFLEPVPEDRVHQDIDISISPTSYEDASAPGALIQPTLRHSASRDSLVSISGMDIHIAKRPSTRGSNSSKLLGGNRAYFSIPPSPARSFSASQPISAVTTYTALRSMRSFSSDQTSSVDFHSAVSDSPIRGPGTSIEALSGLTGNSNPSSPIQAPATGGIGRLVGGWVRGRWGVAPTKSSTNLRASVSSASSGESSLPPTPPALFAGRAPGINQPGAIPGFMPKRSMTGSTVQVTMLDEEALRQTLAE